MAEYLVPTRAAEVEFVEKRSTFIGHLWPVETEEEARAKIDEMKRQYYDARHNCWCYIIQDGPMRYSDDGEPQGTAGQPMLSLFQKEGMTNLCCVVTRYFGGVLLGAGGLVRAYTQCAKHTLDRAGISVMRPWVELTVDCPYGFLERVKQLCASHGGVVSQVEYAAQVAVHVLLPQERTDPFQSRLIELSAGEVQAAEVGQVFRAVPVED